MAGRRRSGGKGIVIVSFATMICARAVALRLGMLVRGEFAFSAASVFHLLLLSLVPIGFIALACFGLWRWPERRMTYGLLLVCCGAATVAGALTN